MAGVDQPRDPIVESASGPGWRRWLLQMLRAGWRWLGAAGLLLVAGFGAGLLALTLFADLADEVMEQETLQLDTAVLHWLQRFQSPALDVVARLLSLMGSEVVAVLLVVLTVLLARQRRWGALGALLLTTIGAQLLNNVLKDLFQRTRPAPLLGLIPAQAFSFPSGHAMVSAAFYFFLAYLGWRIARGWRRWLIAAALLLLVLLIGLSRLYLGVHYLTDVAAGYLVGFLWADAVIIAGQLLKHGRRWVNRRAVRDPPP